ncbi:MAG TPA: hypothetical protein VFR90_11300 [Methylibium sp.]|uniref:hypothetical protein n=1 Tax=Methylibium sp. TaxID=2067992 RepID=UPI002DB853E4|nr:hypothetical protein [Methylibium sp.]HEU4459699.1 hypothetical protein [Methylibium sp.]
MSEAEEAIVELVEAAGRFTAMALGQQPDELLQQVHAATASGARVRVELDLFGLGQRRIALLLVSPQGECQEITRVVSQSQPSVQ